MKTESNVSVLAKGESLSIAYPGSPDGKRCRTEITHCDPRIEIRVRLYAVAKRITLWEAWSRLVLVGLGHEGYVLPGDKNDPLGEKTP